MVSIRWLLVALAVFCLAASNPSVSVSAETTTSGKAFERIFVIIFENHGFKQVVANGIWQNLISKGRLLTNYFGITHPSQPNYITIAGADTLGVVDNQDYNLNHTNLVDLLEAKGITWRTYQDAYIPMEDGDCNPASVIGRYVRKHNPFMSFTNISQNKTRCRNIVPETQLDEDIRNNKVPQFSFYTPDMDHSSHDQDLNFAGKWFSGFLDKYMNQANFINNTLLLVTWDEDEYLENNRIASFMLGPYVKPGTSHNGYFDHYSLTRSVELNWGLGDLGRNDVTATNFLDAIQG